MSFASAPPLLARVLKIEVRAAEARTPPRCFYAEARTPPRCFYLFELLSPPHSPALLRISYSELRATALLLRKIAPTVTLPPFPPRHPFGQPTSSFLYRRALSLETFLCAVLASPCLSSLPPFQLLLGSSRLDPPLDSSLRIIPPSSTLTPPGESRSLPSSSYSSPPSHLSLRSEASRGSSIQSKSPKLRPARAPPLRVERALRLLHRNRKAPHASWCLEGKRVRPFSPTMRWALPVGAAVLIGWVRGRVLVAVCSCVVGLWARVGHMRKSATSKAAVSSRSPHTREGCSLGCLPSTALSPTYGHIPPSSALQDSPGRPPPAPSLPPPSSHFSSPSLATSSLTSTTRHDLDLASAQDGSSGAALDPTLQSSERFLLAIEVARRLPRQKKDIMLQLYALYKQAGGLDAPLDPPSRMQACLGGCFVLSCCTESCTLLSQMTARAKWDAWDAQRGLGVAQAQVRICNSLAVPNGCAH